VQKAHDGHRLLRPRRERPNCRTAEKCDERPPLHSITSSECEKLIGNIEAECFRGS
jgi:hypothetical protein